MEYLQHLQKDKKLVTILTESLPPLRLRKNIAVRLMASIMSQQLSTKVAQSLFRTAIAYGLASSEPGAIRFMDNDIKLFGKRAET